MMVSSSSSAESYSSRISPTISSSKSSIDTSPAVPPYSSTTIIMWTFSVRISSSSSSTFFCSGVNLIGRRILSMSNFCDGQECQQFSLGEEGGARSAAARGCWRDEGAHPQDRAEECGEPVHRACRGESHPLGVPDGKRLRCDLGRDQEHDRQHERHHQREPQPPLDRHAPVREQRVG